MLIQINSRPFQLPMGSQEPVKRDFPCHFLKFIHSYFFLMSVIPVCYTGCKGKFLTLINIDMQRRLDSIGFEIFIRNETNVCIYIIFTRRNAKGWVLVNRELVPRRDVFYLWPREPEQKSTRATATSGLTCYTNAINPYAAPQALPPSHVSHAPSQVSVTQRRSGHIQNHILTVSQ